MVIFYKSVSILQSLEILPNLGYMLHECLCDLAGFESADTKIVHYGKIISSQDVSII